MKNYTTPKSQNKSSINQTFEGPTPKETVLYKQEEKMDSSTPTKDSLAAKKESATKIIQKQDGRQIRSETQAIECLQNRESAAEELPCMATESETTEEKIIRTKSPSVIKSPRSEKVSRAEEKISIVEVKWNKM